MPSKIRSNYQRRVLDWLSDGGGTISNAAKNLDLRLPHASATFKKLRHENLITVDQIENQKGTIQRLTKKGWEKLEEDELARTMSINFKEIPENAEGCLIAREGPMLLLGYIKKQDKQGHMLPNIPLFEFENRNTDSSRNKGVEVEWSWAISREKHIRWFSFPDFKQLKQFEEEEEGITNWSEKKLVIGLIRVRLLESENFFLPVGSWFPKPPRNTYPKLPPILNEDYSWTLATFHDNNHKIKPQQPVVAEINRRLGINLLLEAAARDGIIIGEAGLLSRKIDYFPISVLKYWIKRIHPKLSEIVQEERLKFLLEEIGIYEKTRKKRRSSGEQSTWSKFNLDWPNSSWGIDNHSNELFFDSSELSKNSLLSLIEWSMNESRGVPLSIQWPKNINLNKIECEKIIRYPALRIIILDKWNGDKPNLFLKESRFSSLPIMDLQLERGLKLPISVEITPFETETVVSTESYNIPNELKLLLEKSKIKIDDNSEKSSRILSCCKQYPTGNEFEANKLEYEFPLESWIITPSNLRWLRWQRISNRLDAHWVELLSPDLIPERFLGTIALNTPEKWKVKAREIIKSKLQNNPNLSLELRKIILKSTDEEKAWWFSAIIDSIPWLAPSIRINLIQLGLEPWIKYNNELKLDNFSNVLNYLNWMQRIGEINGEWCEKLNKINEIDENSNLNIWKALIKKYQSNSNPSFETISKIISTFDMEWWAPLAEEFLKECLESNLGKLWIESADISWCAAILREKDEIHDIPGYDKITHPGCSNELLDYLNQFLTKLDQKMNKTGIMQLTDLKNSLTSIIEKSPPKIGICHRHSGWLAQPIKLWPENYSLIDKEGDESVSKRIQLRKSGFHIALENSPQSKLI